MSSWVEYYNSHALEWGIVTSDSTSQDYSSEQDGDNPNASTSASDLQDAASGSALVASEAPAIPASSTGLPHDREVALVLSSDEFAAPSPPPSGDDGQQGHKKSKKRKNVPGANAKPGLAASKIPPAKRQKRNRLTAAEIAAKNGWPHAGGKSEVDFAVFRGNFLSDPACAGRDRMAELGPLPRSPFACYRLNKATGQFQIARCPSHGTDYFKWFEFREDRDGVSIHGTLDECGLPCTNWESTPSRLAIVDSSGDIIAHTHLIMFTKSRRKNTRRSKEPSFQNSSSKSPSGLRTLTPLI